MSEQDAVGRIHCTKSPVGRMVAVYKKPTATARKEYRETRRRVWEKYVEDAIIFVIIIKAGN